MEQAAQGRPLATAIGPRRLGLAAAVRRAPWPTASSVGEAHGRLPDLLEQMRHLYIILMAFAAALFSCGRPDYPTELLPVDSLSEVRPDSAKAVLGRVGQGLEAFDDDARWYYRLLRLKVRGKVYDAFSAVDSAEAFDVLAHYRGEGDSALCYFDRAIRCAKSLRDSVLVNGFVASLASYYISVKDYRKADSCLAPYVSHVNVVDKIPIYGMMAVVCMNTGRYEEGYLYCAEMLSEGTILSKQNACRLILLYYSHHGDMASVSKYVSLLSEYTDSLDKVTAKDVVARMNASYNLAVTFLPLASDGWSGLVGIPIWAAVLWSLPFLADAARFVFEPSSRLKW